MAVTWASAPATEELLVGADGSVWADPAGDAPADVALTNTPAITAMAVAAHRRVEPRRHSVPPAVTKATLTTVATLGGEMKGRNPLWLPRSHDRRRGAAFGPTLPGQAVVKAFVIPDMGECPPREGAELAL